MSVKSLSLSSVSSVDTDTIHNALMGVADDYEEEEEEQRTNVETRVS